MGRNGTAGPSCRHSGVGKSVSFLGNETCAALPSPHATRAESITRTSFPKTQPRTQLWTLPKSPNRPRIRNRCLLSLIPGRNPFPVSEFQDNFRRLIRARFPPLSGRIRMPILSCRPWPRWGERAASAVLRRPRKPGGAGEAERRGETVVVEHYSVGVLRQARSGPDNRLSSPTDDRVEGPSGAGLGVVGGA